MGLSPREWLVTESFVPLPLPTYQLLKQTTPWGHAGKGTFRCDCRDQGARRETLCQAQPLEVSTSPRWWLPPPATICCLAQGLGDHVGRQDKPVPSRHSLPRRRRGHVTLKTSPSQGDPGPFGNGSKVALLGPLGLKKPK